LLPGLLQSFGGGSLSSMFGSDPVQEEASRT